MILNWTRFNSRVFIHTWKVTKKLKKRVMGPSEDVEKKGDELDALLVVRETE